MWSYEKCHLSLMGHTTLPSSKAVVSREKSKRSWAELYALEIDRAADVTVFHQIYLQLRSAILSGTLHPATKLPSTRALAAQLGVSRSAVVSAFEQLLAEGYATGKSGAGTFIASDLPEPFGASHGRKKRSASAAKPVTPLQGPSDSIDVTMQSDERPFNLGRTLVDARTAEQWRKLSAHACCGPSGGIILAMAICTACRNYASPCVTISWPRVACGASLNKW